MAPDAHDGAMARRLDGCDASQRRWTALW